MMIVVTVALARRSLSAEYKSLRTSDSNKYRRETITDESQIQNRQAVGCLLQAGFVSVGDNSLFVLFIPTSIVSDHNNKKMPLGDDCHDWKMKTTDVKDHYDFKKVLGM